MKICKFCNKKFLTKDKRQIYCSLKCGGKAANPTSIDGQGTKSSCPLCGIEFVRKRIGQIHCSIKCANKNRSLGEIGKIVNCHKCDKEFAKKRKEQKFCSPKCASIFNNKKRKKYLSIPDCLDNADRKIDKNIGYVRIYVGKNYPGANTWGYAYEHRVIAETMLGRKLKSNEHVHHKNHCRWDNRPDNLQVMSASEHGKLTQEELREEKNDFA